MTFILVNLKLMMTIISKCSPVFNDKHVCTNLTTFSRKIAHFRII